MNDTGSPVVSAREQAPAGGGSATRDPVRTIAHILRATAIVVGVAALLYALSSAFVIIILAVIFATLLRGLGNELNHYTKLNTTASVLLVFLALVVLICGLGYWAGPKFVTEARQLWSQVSSELSSLPNLFGTASSAGGGGSGGISGLASSGMTSRLTNLLGTVATSTIGFFGALLVIIATGVYLAISPGMYISGIAHLTPLWYQERTRSILLEMGAAMQGWMLGQLVDMIIVGVITGIGLSLVGAPLAFVLAVFAGFCTFIPYFGTIISAVPAVIVSLTVSLRMMIWVICIFAVAHVIEGYVVAPFVQRRTVHLPPALTLLSMLILVAIFNIFGVLIATPLMAVIMVGIARVYVEDILGDPAGRKLTVRSRWYWFTPPEVMSPDETVPPDRTG